MERRDARLHVRDHPRETLGREPPRRAHRRELRLVLERDRCRRGASGASSAEGYHRDDERREAAGRPPPRLSAPRLPDRQRRARLRSARGRDARARAARGAPRGRRCSAARRRSCSRARSSRRSRSRSTGGRSPTGSTRSTTNRSRSPRRPSASRSRRVVRIHPERNTALSGLYRSSGNFCTQCEAHGFRRITWFLDRPDVMARYAVRIEADRERYPVLLSNGNREAEERPRRRSPRGALARPVAQALVPVRAGRGQPAPPRGHLHDALRARGRARDLGRAAERRPLRARAALAPARDALGRAGVRARVRARRVHDRRGRRLQHGRDGEQGPQHLQREVRAREARHRDRRRVRGDRGGDRPRVLPQLDRQPRHVPRLVPAHAEGRAHGVPRSAVHRRPDVGGGEADPRRGGAAHEPVPRGRRADGAPDPARVVHLDGQLLHRDGVREGRRGGAALSHAVRRGRLPARHGPLLRAPRRPGRHLRRLPRRAWPTRTAPTSRDFERWYAQAGTPRLEARGEWDAAAHTYSLHLRQSLPTAPEGDPREPLPIPVRMGLLGADGRDLPLRLAGERGAAPTTRVLLLDEREATFRFEDIAEQPVPSLLRQFSAPVVLAMPRSRSELAFLFAHDSDPVSRWDAGQTLAQELLLEMAADAAAGRRARARCGVRGGDRARARRPRARRVAARADARAAESARARRGDGDDRLRRRCTRRASSRSPSSRGRTARASRRSRASGRTIGRIGSSAPRSTAAGCATRRCAISPRSATRPGPPRSSSSSSAPTT